MSTQLHIIPPSTYVSDQAVDAPVTSGVIHAVGHPSKRDIHVVFTDSDVARNVAYPSLASDGYTVSCTNFRRFSWWSKLNPSVTLTPSGSGGFYRVDATSSGSRYSFAYTPVHIRRHVKSAAAEATPNHIASQKDSAMACASRTKRGAATCGRDNLPLCHYGGVAARGRTGRASPPAVQ